MPHITAPDLSAIDDDVREQYERFRTKHAHFDELRAVLVRFPSALGAVDEMYRQVMNKGQLGRVLREQVFVAASVVRGCGYAVAGHGGWLLGSGDLAPDAVAALEAAENPVSASAPERILLDVCRKVAAAAYRTVAADINRLEEAGWGRQEIVEALTVVALSGWMNGIAAALGLEVGDTARVAT